ncbi:MAG: BLUF domain-containing protein [Methylotenera sp.]|nr:BLUF domain-containing protein [Methylotenera sp.]
MKPEKLTHLIYTSAATAAFNPADLKALLQAARSQNTHESITGLLLYTSGSFFQVLEGDEAKLMELFAHISLDPRHMNVTKIIQEPIAQRSFGDWTMGYSEVSSAELETIEGLNDFFRQGSSLTNLDSGRAKKLLSAFAQGRWRARLKCDTK